MKRILIIGKNSYIGNSLIDWLQQYGDEYQTETLSLREAAWKEANFSNFDVVVHVAGIAHVSTDPDLENQYYKVNRDLTIEVAEKAKREGVAQFIFLSSIIVYGDGNVNREHITKETIPEPSNYYGNSKLQAEQGIRHLMDETFKIAVIRPPMVYGKNSKGNYPKLAKMARYIPIFPNIENKRSMLYIDNLTEMIRLLIINQESGLFHPQNAEYAQTSELVRLIRKVNGKKTYLTKLFNPFITPFINRINLINKLFGNLTYDLNISEYKENYRVFTFEESIEATER